MDISGFTKIFDKIAYGKSESTVFDDFLDICICCLSAERYEEEYLAMVKKYGRKDMDLFAQLFAEMTIAMDNEGSGLADCLGEFFTEHITRGRNGQFFTPAHVCDFMGEVTIDKNSSGKTVFDPACGSGRMLLSAAKVSRSNLFFGADIDHRCCKMTAINLCMNALFGEVAWMNSLSLEHWGGYEIVRYEKHMFAPTIRKLGAKEGRIYASAPQRNGTADKGKEGGGSGSNVSGVNGGKTETTPQTKLDL